MPALSLPLLFAETGPAFENLQGRKPRVGRASPPRDLWGFESRWRLLSSGRNDYQRRFRRIERSEGVFSGGNGIIFSRRPCSRKAPGASLGERRRRGGKRELGCGVAGDAISIMTCRS